VIGPSAGRDAIYATGPIDLFNEVAANRRGPAHAWISRNAGADLWVSPVTYAEVLEGADDVVAVR
jgi:hypothetical protein